MYFQWLPEVHFESSGFSVHTQRERERERDTHNTQNKIVSND